MKMNPLAIALSIALSAGVLASVHTAQAQVAPTEGRKPVYLLKYSEGDTEKYVYVDSPAEFSYEFNAYVGEMGKMEKIEVLNVQRMRDGGTTTITLSGGSIFVPSIFKRDVDATYTDGRGLIHTVTDVTAETRDLSAEEISAMIGDSSNSSSDTSSDLKKKIQALRENSNR